MLPFPKVNFSVFELTDWFARKNVDDKVIVVTICFTGTNQVCSITDNVYSTSSPS